MRRRSGDGAPPSFWAASEITFLVALCRAVDLQDQLTTIETRQHRPLHSRASSAVAGVLTIVIAAAHARRAHPVSNLGLSGPMSGVRTLGYRVVSDNRRGAAHVNTV